MSTESGILFITYHNPPFNINKKYLQNVRVVYNDKGYDISPKMYLECCKLMKKVEYWKNIPSSELLEQLEYRFGKHLTDSDMILVICNIVILLERKVIQDDLHNGFVCAYLLPG